MSSSSNKHIMNVKLVENILEQGQKLRNAMVESVLRNDPSCCDVLNSKHLNTPYSTCVNLNGEKSSANNSPEQKCLEAFIRGDHLAINDEKIALQTLKSISASQLFKTVENTLDSFTNYVNKNCKCQTCFSYNSANVDCDLKRNKSENPDSSQNHSIAMKIQNIYENENQKYIKYIDSVKISIGTLNINDTGWQKICNTFSNKNFNLTNYFLEYSLPDSLVPHSKQSKVDSGIGSNSVKICAKKTNDTISFKHIALHSLKNFTQSSVKNAQIQFKLRYRGYAQKQFYLLGCASFDVGELLTKQNLTCLKGLTIQIDKNVPIVVGTLKVLFQLGCGNLYFGQEFIDAINFSQKDNTVLDSDDSVTELVYLNDRKVNVASESRKQTNLKESSRPIPKPDSSDAHAIDSVSKTKFQKHSIGVQTTQADNNKPLKRETLNKSQNTLKGTLPRQIKEDQKQLLFGFLFIAEAEYSEDINPTYFKAQLFSQSDAIDSRLIKDTSNPIFDFCHIAPLLYDDELLFYLRDNFLVVEFWHKTHSTDKSFGLTKIPLHTFYLAYRNPFILKHLIKNKLPIVGTDWWEPIYSLDNEDIVGQLKVLVALGTDEQINNLKTERGFNLKFVTANSSRQKQVRSCVVEKQKPRVLTSEKNIQVHSVAKQDATTQVDAKKYLRFSPEPKMEDKEPKASNITQELLGSFLNQLMAQKKQAPPAKSGVNIETNANEGVIEENLQNVQSVTNVQLKRTSDLLDSLQKAISVDKVQNKQHASSLKGYFQAAVSINSANHLPSRKRCKSKRSRSFSNKTEENILPSCYVSFENIPEDPLKVTPVIFRTTTPVWNFKCNVKLPLELLHNPQKKLIFKVWRKSNSAVSTPNMQADTVLGFAAMDLTVLLSGFPNIQGWFNIIDFSGKCNGQINIHVTPLEDLSPYKIQRDCPLYSTEIAGQQNAEPKDQPPSDPKEPSELLSRALKRKFSELDEITQRLRLRLSKVTDEDSDASSDGVTEQFEKDINTLSIEEDFDLINFENDTGNLKDRKVENVQSSLLMTDEQIEENEDDTSRESSKLKSGSSLTVETSNNSHTSLDQNLLAGKQQISSLLEKLTLLSAESNSLCQDRYVSGCSTSKDNASGNAFIDTEAILQELDHSSRPNIQSALAFTVEEMLDIYDSLEDSKSGDAVTSSNTDTSLITNFSDYRLAPEGQGNTSEDNDLQYNKTK